MKNTILIFAFLITSIFGFSQTNGINYKALIKDNIGNVVDNQTITVQFSILKGVAQTNVYQETHSPTTDANGIIFLNIGEGTTSDDFSTIDWSSDDHFLNVKINTGIGLTDMGTTQFMAVPYALSAANVTGLEAIDEGNGIGWRLKGQDPANYDDIGLYAVDLSYSPSANEFYGASGDYSTSMGAQTTASGAFSTAINTATTASGSYSTAMGFGTNSSGVANLAIGAFNIGDGNPSSWIATDPLFEIGNGISESGRSNAFTVLKNGTITAPSFDLAEITDDKALITKEYADTNLLSSGLEAVDEGNGIGFRLKGRDPLNYSNIGENAVDFSISDLTSEVNGASARNSTAMGVYTKASGSHSTAFGWTTEASGNTSTAMGSFTTASGFSSTAMGRNSQASGDWATAMGLYTVASGNASTAMGNNTIASGSYATAMGRNNVGGGNPTNWVATDPLFEIGIGSSSVNRSNALTVLKNGKIGIGNQQPTGFLEVKAANLSGEPNLNLIHEGTTGARINFSNTDTTNGNVWTFYGDTNDIDANSVFNIYHPNAPSNGNIIQIKGDGHVGINGAPDTEFHITHGASGATDGLKLQNSGANANWWRFYTVNSTGNLELFSKSQGVTPVGNFNGVSGAYTSTSDRRLKKNLKDLHFNWTDFMKLETLNYQYKAQKDTTEYIGLIAQDVALIYPELVTYNEDSDVYHMNYAGFGVIAIKAVQELKNEVDILKTENAMLKAKLKQLESLEARILAVENITNTNQRASN